MLNVECSRLITCGRSHFRFHSHSPIASVLVLERPEAAGRCFAVAVRTRPANPGNQNPSAERGKTEVAPERDGFVE